jgi:hypothetical protein
MRGINKMICKGTRIPDMILSLMDILEDDGYMSHISIVF